MWWLGLTGLWVLTLSTPSLPELVAAVVAGLICALAARAGRRAMGGAWRPRLAWAGWLRHVPLATVRETGWILRRRPDGRFDDVELPAESENVHEARLAVAAAVVGSTPGTMVVATPPGERRLVVHRMLDEDSPLLREVRR